MVPTGGCGVAGIQYGFGFPSGELMPRFNVLVFPASRLGGAGK